MNQKNIRYVSDMLLTFLSPLNVTAEENAKRILTGLIVIITCPVFLNLSLPPKRWAGEQVWAFQSAMALSKTIKGPLMWRRPVSAGRPFESDYRFQNIAKTPYRKTWDIGHADIPPDSFLNL